MTLPRSARCSMHWRQAATDSPMDWLILAGSLTAIVAVAALVHCLRLGDTAIENAAHAIKLAEDNLPGFEADSAIISTDREAAIVRGKNRTAALIKRHGAQFAMREMPLPLTLTQDGETCIVDSGELSFGRVSLSLSKEDADKLLTLV